MERLGLPEDQPIQHGMITKSLESAQRKVEGHNFDIRKHLVEYDDVMNKQRTYIYKLRSQILTGESLKDNYLEILEAESERLVNANVHAETGEIIEEDLAKAMENILGSKVQFDKKTLLGSHSELTEAIQAVFVTAYEDKEKRIGSDLMRILERALYLRTIDMLWIDHLDAIDHLREGIGLRGYGQKDPLIEYKNESYRMFKTLLGAIDAEIINLIYKVEISAAATAPETRVTKMAEQAKGNEAKDKSQAEKGKKTVGRNDLCPCGSGKKYKKCCGK